MSFLQGLMGVPGEGLLLPRPASSLSGLSSFDAGPLVKIHGIPRPTGRAPVNPDVCRKIKIPTGARGTTETLEIMKELAIEGSQDPGFVQEARGLVRECGSRDTLCEAATILRCVHECVDYRNDPSFAEYIQSPGWTWFIEGAGDCDDASCLIATFDISVGRGARFVAFKLDRARPDEFSHVQCQVGIRGPRGVEWLGQDSIVQNPKLGWSPPAAENIGPPNILVVAEP